MTGKENVGLSSVPNGIIAGPRKTQGFNCRPSDIAYNVLERFRQGTMTAAPDSDFDKKNNDRHSL
jgi:hypothetical protein